MYKKLCGLAVAGVVLFASPAAAQVPDVHVEPYVGIFVPVNEVANDDVLGFGFKIDQQSALAAGVRATMFPSARFARWGLQANFVYAFSDADIRLGTIGPRQETAYVWALDGRIVYALRPDPTAVFLSGGLGVITRGDDAYQNVTDGETDLMGVLGGGLRFDVAESVAFRLDTDGYFYFARPTVASPDFNQDLKLDSDFQIDLVFSAGLQFAFSP